MWCGVVITGAARASCIRRRAARPVDGLQVGNLQWRIKDPIAGTRFVTRYAVQEFVQDPKVPGILYNHDNEFLHYQARPLIPS